MYPEDKIETQREQMRLEGKMFRIIFDGLKAYGIEHDKIPEFMSRIRDVVRSFMEFPQRDISTNLEFQGTSGQLWNKAAMRNPHTEGVAKREEIWQFINEQLPFIVPESEQERLKWLIFEIIDDEDIKQKTREAYDEEMRK